MAQQGFEHNLRILDLIEEGMKVYDRDGDEVGEVDGLHYGASGDYRYGQAPTASASPDDYVDPVTDFLQDVFNPDRLPEELRERLLNNGFLHVDGPGLLDRDRFVLPEQIAAVNDDGVQLRVSRDELIND